ncbi:MAG: FkbM family methyltransferase [Candidatus Omnitrophica bacterium]|nr:FkbM family methyltransferase [Candidatus Omnitrophota bacterium]
MYLKQTQGRALTLIDGGARGELFDPFSAVACPLEVVAFDPDVDAPKGTQKERVRRHFINKALWKETGTVKVHIAHQPATSSVYPPDLELLRTFPDHVGAPQRTTEKVVEIESISIDEAVDQGLCPSPDFIKLDIHSAEFEALQGAENSLRTSFGVLVESWHSPIHRGQHLTGELEWFLNQRGFFLFHIMHNSPWPHVVDGKNLELDRPRMVGTESLFLRDDLHPSNSNQVAGLHALAIADLFRYNRFAVLLSRKLLEQKVLDTDLQWEVEKKLNWIAEERLRSTRAIRFFKRRFRNLVRRMLS